MICGNAVLFGETGETKGYCSFMRSAKSNGILIRPCDLLPENCAALSIYLCPEKYPLDNCVPLQILFLWEGEGCGADGDPTRRDYCHFFEK